MSSEQNRYVVVGLGNALVDALVRIDDDSVLTKFGLPRGHMSPVDHDTWQRVFEGVQEYGVEIQSGGSCANTIAALGLMGTDVTYCGQVGHDQLGHLYASKMEEACGGYTLKWSKEHNTGKCLSIISKSDAERTMVTDLGAAVHMDSLGEFETVLKSANILH